jgi:HK97 family phage major capsid protein
MPSLAELREEMAAKSAELHEVFVQAGPDLDMDKVRVIHGTTDEKAAWIKQRNDELSRLGIEKDRLESLETIGRLNERTHQDLNAPVDRPALPGSKQAAEDYGRQVLRNRGVSGLIKEHKGWQEFVKGLRRDVSIDLPIVDFKALITLSNINSQAARQGPVDMALEERTVGDLMAQGATDRNTIEYYEETTLTNAAATVAEGGTKPESALGWTLRTESVRKIATFIPATRESLDDVAFLEATIRNRLAFMVRRAEETQLLSGDGVAPNILGLLNRSGIQTQAKGAEPTPDAIYKGMQKVRGAGGSGFAEPTGVVLHPNDWTDIKLLRTADGIYIWGNPSEEGPDRIWGLPVRQTTAMPENTGLVGAFRPYAEVIRREGITVTLSTEHSTYFVENKVAILAEERLALAVYRPSAFSTVTGI